MGGAGSIRYSMPYDRKNPFLPSADAVQSQDTGVDISIQTSSQTGRQLREQSGASVVLVGISPLYPYRVPCSIATGVFTQDNDTTIGGYSHSNRQPIHQTCGLLRSGGRRSGVRGEVYVTLTGECLPSRGNLPGTGEMLLVRRKCFSPVPGRLPKL